MPCATAWPGIIKGQAHGYDVFSAPWETVGMLLAMIDAQYGYGLDLPSAFLGANYLYAISCHH